MATYFGSQAAGVNLPFRLGTLSSIHSVKLLLPLPPFAPPDPKLLLRLITPGFLGTIRTISLAHLAMPKEPTRE